LTDVLKGFIVGNQIPNLIPDPSFDHNSCILNLNEQCEGILSIYTLRFSNGFIKAQFGVFLLFQLRFWTFKTFAQVQFPKWECTWESLDFIFCTNTLSWPHGPLHLTLNYEPDVRVTTILIIFLLKPFDTYLIITMNIYLITCSLINYNY